MSLLIFCVPLSEQSHLSLNGDVLKFDDSVVDLHKICQILGNCLYKWPLVSSSAPRTFASSFVFPKQFLFRTDKIESIELPNLVPRQRIGDCLWTHIPHWGPRDLPLSCHQTFLLEVRLRQCVFLKEPLSSWFAKQTSQFRSFGKWVLILCFLDFDTTFVGRSESESCEIVCASRHLCVLQIYLWPPPTIPEDLANGRPNVDCHPSFCFCFGFWRDRTSFLGLFRHFAPILDLKMNSMSPAVAM